MGQQQLLLLVLGIVIVGLAVVVGIETFSRSQKSANADALVNDAVRIASDVQRWSITPSVFGGGGDAFTGVSFDHLAYPTGGGGEGLDGPASVGVGDYQNATAVYTLTVDRADQVTLTGCNAALGNAITTVITGATPADIVTEVSVEGC